MVLFQKLEGNGCTYAANIFRQWRDERKTYQLLISEWEKWTEEDFLLCKQFQTAFIKFSENLLHIEPRNACNCIAIGKSC